MTDWSYTLLVDSYKRLNVYQSTGSKYHYHDLNTYLKDLKKELSVVQGKQIYTVGRSKKQYYPII